MSSQLFADDVKFHQRILRLSGHYAGEIDGIWGPDTEKADQAFQPQYEAIRDRMGNFDPRTEQNIRGLLPKAQRAARTFMTAAQQDFRTFSVRILSGTRTYAEQDGLFAKGRTAPGPIVTHAHGGQSNHNFGIAWDVGLFDGNGRYLTGAQQGDDDAYRGLAALMKSQGLEWGGDWVSFRDMPHYQLHSAFGLTQIAQHFEQGTAFV